MKLGQGKGHRPFSPVMEFIFFGAADQKSASEFYHSASRKLFTFVLSIDYLRLINVGRVNCICLFVSL